MSSGDETAREKIVAETVWAIRRWQERMTPEELAVAIVSAPAILMLIEGDTARADGYRAGQLAMRERAARSLQSWSADFADQLRTLAIEPEGKP